MHYTCRGFRENSGRKVIGMNNTLKMSGRALMLGGIVLVVFGILLLLSPVAAGELVVMLVALVLVLTGLAQAFQAFRVRNRAEALVSGVLGVIVAGLGVMVWLNPEIGSGFLTALLMIFFITHGLWKVTTAWRFRGMNGWAWLMASGVLSLIFVYLLWAQWPLAGAWAIGVFIGLDLLLSGIAMIILSLATRRARTSGYVDTINL